MKKKTEYRMNESSLEEQTGMIHEVDISLERIKKYEKMWKNVGWWWRDASHEVHHPNSEAIALVNQVESRFYLETAHQLFKTFKELFNNIIISFKFCIKSNFIFRFLFFCFSLFFRKICF